MSEKLTVATHYFRAILREHSELIRALIKWDTTFLVRSCVAVQGDDVIEGDDDGHDDDNSIKMVT